MGWQRVRHHWATFTFVLVGFLFKSHHTHLIAFCCLFFNSMWQCANPTKSPDKTRLHCVHWSKYIVIYSAILVWTETVLFIETRNRKINDSKHPCTYCVWLLLFLYDRFPGIGLLVKFSSVAQSGLTLCDPTDCSMPGLPVHHQVLEFSQTPVYWVSDVIQPYHPRSSFSLSQHQGLFQWVCSSHQVAKVLEFQLQHRSFQGLFRTDFL